MPTFQNREEAIETICIKTDQNVLLNVYGEAGIGKSRLLEEASQRLRTKSPPVLVLYVNLESLAAGSTDPPKQVLQTLIDKAQEHLSGVWQNTDQVAGQIVAQLGQLAQRMSVYLIFDTTEVFQENMDFWRWMEKTLVGPLVVEGQIRQVFAGRLPVPWHRVEVRRAVKLIRLNPLPVEKDARNLVREVLQEDNPNLQHTEENQKGLEDAVDWVLEFSFGHPLLSEKLAAYVATHWPVSSSDEFKRELCTTVVKPFIEEEFFKEIDPPWNEILWWASVLDWFDVTLLQQYLERVDQDLIRDKSDYFFIQGITRLRIHNTVVWREERGDRLHGIIDDIVRHCFEIMEPERYRQACLAAAETMETLASEFPEDDPEAQQYHQEAEMYRQWVKEEEER